MDDAITGFVLALLLGLLPAYIAQRKGRSFFRWWAFGTFLLIAALPWILIVKPKNIKQCPLCAESVKRNALVCKHCRYSFITDPAIPRL